MKILPRSNFLALPGPVVSRAWACLRFTGQRHLLSWQGKGGGRRNSEDRRELDSQPRLCSTFSSSVAGPALDNDVLEVAPDVLQPEQAAGLPFDYSTCKPPLEVVDSRERFDVATEGERVALAVSSQEHQLQTGSELETEGGGGGDGGGGERCGSISGRAGDLEV